MKSQFAALLTSMGIPTVIAAKEVIKTSERDSILKTLGEVRYAQLIYDEIHTLLIRYQL